MKTLLDRTSLTIPFEKFLGIVELQFSSLGRILSYKPIMEGYEDANFLLETSRGKFVLKIFSKDRSFENVQSYVKVLSECMNIDVQTTEMIINSNGGLGEIESGRVKTYFIVTKFFQGHDFQNITPAIQDIKAITEYISRLNTLSFKVAESYDSWGNKNLAKEYLMNKSKLSSGEQSLIEPVYKGFVELDFSLFNESVIHGDMQRKHVLKNVNGNFCILDFGCMAFGPKVIDLSTFLAWFCLQEDTWKDREEIFRVVLDIYNKVHHLSRPEMNSLRTLTKASYAAYFLKTSILIDEGDKSEETQDWYSKSKKMLVLSKDWKQN